MAGREDVNETVIVHEEDVRGRDNERPRESAKRGKTRSKSRPPLIPHNEGTSGDETESRLSYLESFVFDIKDQLDQLKESVELMIQENIEVTKAAKLMVRNLAEEFKMELDVMSRELLSARKFAEEEIHGIHEKINVIQKECKDRRQASHSGDSSSHGISHSILKVPKPDMYNGSRNATVVENFLFGLEQYFEAMGVIDDAIKINNAPAFLRESAQLWWRRRHSEREKGTCVLDTWEQFKAELRKHFVPRNADAEARGRLRRLRQTGTISEYIKDFTTITLEIENLSEHDALFYFKDGLQEWAQIELERRNVETLDDAIAAAESLTDYTSKLKNLVPTENRRDEGMTRKPDERKEENQKQEKAFAPKRDPTKPSKPCFICDGPHWTRECPSRKAMNALVAELNPSEAEENKGNLGSIRYLGSLSEVLSKAKRRKHGLLFADLLINNKSSSALIDTGASHNFMDSKEAERLGVKYVPAKGMIKVVNTEAKPIIGVSKTKVRINGWTKELTFTIVPMDDFRIVLGLEFFKKTHAFPIPSVKSLVILDNEQIQVTPLNEGNNAMQLLSALQFKRRVTEDNCLATKQGRSTKKAATIHKNIVPDTKSPVSAPNRMADTQRFCFDKVARRTMKCADTKGRKISVQTPKVVVTEEVKERDHIQTDHKTRKRGVPHPKEYLLKWKGKPENGASSNEGEFLMKIKRIIKAIHTKKHDEDVVKSSGGECYDPIYGKLCKGNFIKK